MALFKVKSIDWLDTDDEASEFEAYDAEDAVLDWCKCTDGGGGFTDGYPDAHIVQVTDEDGVKSFHSVSTDWSPDFYVYDAPAS